MMGGWVSRASGKNINTRRVFFGESGNKKFTPYVHTFHVVNVGTRRKGGSVLLLGWVVGTLCPHIESRRKTKSPPNSKLRIHTHRHMHFFSPFLPSKEIVFDIGDK